MPSSSTGQRSGRESDPRLSLAVADRRVQSWSNLSTCRRLCRCDRTSRCYGLSLTVLWHLIEFKLYCSIAWPTIVISHDVFSYDLGWGPRLQKRNSVSQWKMENSAKLSKIRVWRRADSGGLKSLKPLNTLVFSHLCVELCG